MSRILPAAAALIALSSLHAQPSVRVAFNLANCEAHSRQLKALATLDPAIDKVLLIGRADSAIAPWIADRFGLAGIAGLSFGYLPPDRLAGFFTPMGSSTVHVLNGTDTVLCFPLEDLPGRTAAINALARPAHLRLSVRPMEKAGGMPLSSDVHIAATHRSLWLLDRFMGTLHRVGLTDTGRAAMRQVGTLSQLLAKAPSPGPAYGRMWLQPEMIGAVDPATDDPTLLIECIDTNRAQAAFHRVLLTLHDERPRAMEETNIDPRPDGVFPALGLSGFTVQGDRLVGQVLKNMDDGHGFPLFATYEHRKGRLDLRDVAPYDHHTGIIRSWPAYNFTNGAFCDRYFAYASAPVVVDMAAWKELDLSGQLGVSLDSALLFAPQHYFLFDMKCDSEGLTLLCMIEGGYHLARFARQGDRLQLTSLDAIALDGFAINTGVLIDRRTFLFTSTKNDALLIGEWAP